MSTLVTEVPSERFFRFRSRCWLGPRALGFLLLWFLGAAVQAATVFYVDSAWTGSQSGTASAPWTTINWSSINSAVQSGNVTVYFSARQASSSADGQYGSPSTIDFTSGYSPNGANILTLDGSSYYNSSESSPAWVANTGSAMCRVQAFNSQNGSHTKYSNIKIHGFRIRQSAAAKAVAICGDNWTVENCDVAHTSSATDGPCVLLVPTADSSHEGSSYYAPPCTNITIRGNMVHDTYGEAIYVGGGGTSPGTSGSGYPSHNHILIESNIVYNAGVYGGQGDGVDIKGGLDFLTVRGNVITNLTDPGSSGIRAIVMQGQYNQLSGQTRIIEKNYIHDINCTDAAIAVANSWGVVQGLTIRNNCIFNITGSGQGILLYQSQDAVGIYNNTIYNCSSYGVSAYSGSQATLANNLVVNNDSGGTQVSLPSGMSSDYNTYNGAWGYSSEGSHSFALSSTDVGNTFLNPAIGDFHLKTGALVIGKGTVVSGFNDDLAGTLRGSTWDIGAYQASSGSSTPVIAVTPSSQDFGSISVGTTADKTFVVQNIGSGTLSGAASVTSPFSIVSGGSYSLGVGQSQTITVRYSPTTAATNSQSVTFTGGGGAAATVTGVAAQLPSPPQNLHVLAGP